MPLTMEPIDGPQVTPGRRGLLDQVTNPDPSALGRWQLGVATIPDACGVPTPQALDYCSAVAGNLPELTRQGSEEWAPFVVFGYDECSTMGSRPVADRMASARRVLMATASHQAEQQYSTNAAGISGYPMLSDGTATDATSGATAPRYALSALEGDLSRCLHGQRGMIHATPDVVSLWEAEGQLHREGNLLLTSNDHIVVSGSGYTGNDPDDVAPVAGSSWAYGTDLVYAARGIVDTLGAEPEQVDIASNTIRVYVYQPVVLWQSKCCRIAAQVAIDPPA